MTSARDIDTDRPICNGTANIELFTKQVLEMQTVKNFFFTALSVCNAGKTKHKCQESKPEAKLRECFHAGA